jgi:hypothetical protein
MEFALSAYIKVFELLFSLGIKTVLTPTLYPPNFLRPISYLKQAMEYNHIGLLGSKFKKLYDQYGIKARLYGDYDFAPNAAPYRQSLSKLNQSLILLTPDGDKLLLFGYSAGTFTEEVIARSISFNDLKPHPCETDIRMACFPYGPSKIDICLTSGCLRVGEILPPILDGGYTDIYNTHSLMLDIQEKSVRHILFDHLFLRRTNENDFTEYSSDQLKELSVYYQKHASCVTGTGSLIGEEFWYGDHLCEPNG